MASPRRDQTLLPSRRPGGRQARRGRPPAPPPPRRGQAQRRGYMCGATAQLHRQDRSTGPARRHRQPTQRSTRRTGAAPVEASPRGDDHAASPPRPALRIWRTMQRPQTEGGFVRPTCMKRRTPGQPSTGRATGLAPQPLIRRRHTTDRRWAKTSTALPMTCPLHGSRTTRIPEPLGGRTPGAVKLGQSGGMHCPPELPPTRLCA